MWGTRKKAVFFPYKRIAFCRVPQIFLALLILKRLYIHFVEIKLLIHLSAGSLDYIEEEYVDLDGQETDSQTENAKITKVSKRIQPFATIQQEDFEEKSDIEGSGQETNDDEDLQETSKNAHKVLEEEGSGDEKLGK